LARFQLNCNNIVRYEERNTVAPLVGNACSFSNLTSATIFRNEKNARFLISKKTSRDETSPNAVHTVLLAMGLDWHVLSISFF
jgi:hypothetical protein